MTGHGRAIAALPLEPRLAHMLLEVRGARLCGSSGGRRGLADGAWSRWQRYGSGASLATLALGPLSDAPRLHGSSPRGWRRAGCRTATTAVTSTTSGRPSPSPSPTASPRRRDSSGESVAVGRRTRVPTRSGVVAREREWLAVGEVAGHASGARILSAAAIDEQTVLDSSPIASRPATTATSIR